jgi:DNA-binding transcriptional ArsR family regulator
MVQWARSALDLSFSALSDATRRGVLEQLARADASISSLADKFQGVEPA